MKAELIFLLMSSLTTTLNLTLNTFNEQQKVCVPFLYANGCGQENNRSHLATQVLYCTKCSYLVYNFQLSTKRHVEVLVFREDTIEQNTQLNEPLRTTTSAPTTVR